MKKRSKKLIFLAGTLVVLSGATALALKLNPENQDSGSEDSESEALTILEVDENSVTSLKWENGNGEFSFSRDGESWVFDEDSAFPLEESYLDAILEDLSQLQSYQTIENPESLEEYGLDDPAVTVTLSGDSTTTLQIGHSSPMDSLRYLSLGDGNIYLVSSALYNDCNYQLYDLLKLEELPLFSNTSSFEVNSTAGTLLLTYQEDSGLSYSDDYVWFHQQMPLDTDKTNTLLQTVTKVVWKDCVSYNAEGDDLAAYGLEKPQLTASVTYSVDKVEKIFTLEIGDYTDSYCYARIAGSGMVYRIDASVCDTLLHADVSQLRPEDVLRMDWDTVDSLDLVLNGSSYSITRQPGDSSSEDESAAEASYLLDEEEIELQPLLDRLNSMASVGYASGAAQGEPILSFTFQRNSENFSTVPLNFYAYDSTNCLVTLDGEATVLVSRSDVTTLTEDLSDLLS